VGTPLCRPGGRGPQAVEPEPHRCAGCEHGCWPGSWLSNLSPQGRHITGAFLREFHIGPGFMQLEPVALDRQLEPSVGGVTGGPGKVGLKAVASPGKATRLRCPKRPGGPTGSVTSEESILARSAQSIGWCLFPSTYARINSRLRSWRRITKQSPLRLLGITGDRECCAPACSREAYIMPQSQRRSSVIPFAAIERPACRGARPR
jgi:hypothetical protein